MNNSAYLTTPDNNKGGDQRELTQDMKARDLIATGDEQG